MPKPNGGALWCRMADAAGGLGKDDSVSSVVHRFHESNGERPGNMKSDERLLSYGNILPTRLKNYSLTQVMDGLPLTMLVRVSVCVFCSPERRAFEVDAAMNLIANTKGRSGRLVGWMRKARSKALPYPGQSSICQHGRQSSKHCFKSEASRHLALGPLSILRGCAHPEISTRKPSPSTMKH